MNRHIDQLDFFNIKKEFYNRLENQTNWGKNQIRKVFEEVENEMLSKERDDQLLSIDKISQRLDSLEEYLVK